MQNEPTYDLEAEIGLLKKIGAGDRVSFDLLYDRFADRLFGIAYGVLNQREAAEDVVQDVFVQIWEKAALYDASRGRPLTWAVILTRHKAIDRLRSNQRRRQLQEDAEREAETHDPFDEHTSLDAAAVGETTARVRRAMMELPPDQRQSLELAFFSYLTHVEIAEQLQQPLSTIKGRIRRGMAKLRELLPPEEE